MCGNCVQAVPTQTPQGKKTECARKKMNALALAIPMINVYLFLLEPVIGANGRFKLGGQVAITVIPACDSPSVYARLGKRVFR